jgi:hypothetical protein
MAKDDSALASVGPRLRALRLRRGATLTQVAEARPRTPHRVSNPGPGPAEALSLFGPQGERMHVRARPA